MGLGRFKDGKFDVLVSFDGMLTDDEWFAWERAFKKASELLFNATEGQGQFGRIYACDEAVGRATADYVVHVGSGTSTSGGRLGEPGSAINPGFPFWPWHGHSIHRRRPECHVFSR